MGRCALFAEASTEQHNSETKLKAVNEIVN